MADTPPAGDGKKAEHQNATTDADPEFTFVPASDPPHSAPVNAPQNPDSAKQDEAKSIRELSLLEALSVLFNFLLVVTAIIGLAFVYRQTKAMESQLKAMQGQLDSMNTTGNDTRTLAIAAQQQTAAAQLTAFSNALQAIQAVRFAHAAAISAEATKTSAANSDRIARGSENAVKTAQESMRLDQRARIGVSAVTDFHFVGEAPVRAVIRVANTGKAPAMNVRTHAELQAFAIGVPLPPPQKEGVTQSP